MIRQRGRRTHPTPILSMTAAELALKTSVEASIGAKGMLARSLLFAEVSMMAYLDDHETLEAVEQLGFDESLMIERDGAQAYVLQTATDCVVVCRGTETTEWNDVKASLNAFTVSAPPAGRVHRGFLNEVDDLWPGLADIVSTTTKPTWFTGHSLGGAMAMICAVRCASEGSDVEELYTFGSPRVGTARFVRSRHFSHVRWINNTDIVTRVPPPVFGYRHSGHVMYLDSDGRVQRMSPQQRARDRWRGIRASLAKRRIDVVSDHAISAYVANITDASARPHLG